MIYWSASQTNIRYQTCSAYIITISLFLYWYASLGSKHIKNFCRVRMGARGFGIIIFILTIMKLIFAHSPPYYWHLMLQFSCMCQPWRLFISNVGLQFIILVVFDKCGTCQFAIFLPNSYVINLILCWVPFVM